MTLSNIKNYINYTNYIKCCGIIFIISFMFLNTASAESTDSLLLTPQEMQKLKVYFPDSDSPASSASLNSDKSLAPDKISESNNFIINKTNAVNNDGDDYIELIRFAWKNLYAPTRFTKNPFHIVRAPMGTAPILSTLVYGDKFYAHPEGSWHYHELYVTAVELRPKYNHTTTLNFKRDLCGAWKAAVLYAPQSSQPVIKKISTLFLISDKPFGESMAVCNANA